MSQIPAKPSLGTAPLSEPLPGPRSGPHASGHNAVEVVTVTAPVAKPVDGPAPTLPQGPAATSLNFVEDDDETVFNVVGPSLSEIKAGKVLAPGQRSMAVVLLRQLLNEAGYPVPNKGPDLDRFDETVSTALGKFQLAEKLVGPDSPYQGLLGPTTLNRLIKEADEADYDKEVGQRIAKAAIKAKLNDSTSSRQCYAFAAGYIETGVKDNFLSGRHAYMAADQLAKSAYFKEEKVAVKDLKDLPDGAVIVYPAQGKHRSGHIDVVATHPKSGARLAISDFCRPLQASPWRDISDSKVQYRVFIPASGK